MLGFGGCQPPIKDKNDEKQRQTMKSNENRRQTMKTDEETIGKVCTLGFGSWVAKPSISIELRPRWPRSYCPIDPIVPIWTYFGKISFRSTTDPNPVVNIKITISNQGGCQSPFCFVSLETNYYSLSFCCIEIWETKTLIFKYPHFRLREEAGLKIGILRFTWFFKRGPANVTLVTFAGPLLKWLGMKWSQTVCEIFPRYNIEKGLRAVWWNGYIDFKRGCVRSYAQCKE